MYNEFKHIQKNKSFFYFLIRYLQVKENKISIEYERNKTHHN